MRVLTSNDGDLACYFDKVSESEAGIGTSSLEQNLIRTLK